MSKKVFFPFLLLILLFITGCGGNGGGKTSTENPPLSIIKDVLVNNGTGEVTIAANGQVGTLVAIPYNTSLTSGNYQSIISIKADSQTLSVSPIKSQSSLNAENVPDLYAKIRKQEKELVRELFAKGKMSALKQQSLPKPNHEFVDDPNTTLTFKKSFNGQFVTITATKKYSGSRCLIYVDNNATGSHMSQSNFELLGKTFDNFYNVMTSYFGTPNGKLGDIDNNEMIYIVFSELDHSNNSLMLGYFHPINEFSKNDYSNSNEKEMLFATAYKPSSWSDTQWMNQLYGTLAHEFQHLIFFNNRIDKYSTDAEYNSETWITEGLSMVAEDLAIAGTGYKHYSGLDSRINTYLADSIANSLCTWSDSVADYAPAYMFMRYYVDRISEEKIKYLYSNSNIGINLLTSVSGTNSFTSLFRDWLATVYLDRINFSFNDSVFTNNYLYKTLNLASYSALGTLGSGGINFPDSTGGFIVKTGLSGTQQITVNITGNSVFGLRLILLPSN